VLKLMAKAGPPHASFVTEPALAPGNRLPVATAPADTPGAPAAQVERGTKSVKSAMMKRAKEDLVLPRDRNRAFYEAAVRTWFAAHDPAPLQRKLVFDELAQACALHLASNGGLLVADDFNHRVLQFNDACKLEDAILARGLPADYSTLLRRSYARRLIRDGQPLRTAEELSWIAALPADAKAEVTPRACGAAELFRQWYPEAAQLSPAQRDLACGRFLEINHAAGTPPSDAQAEQTIIYPGQAPLLRPTLKQLLNIPAAKAGPPATALSVSQALEKTRPR
jgi:hypothetical protein